MSAVVRVVRGSYYNVYDGRHTRCMTSAVTEEKVSKGGNKRA